MYCSDAMCDGDHPTAGETCANPYPDQSEEDS